MAKVAREARLPVILYGARMIVVGLAAWRAGPVGALAEVRTRHRAWPGDCDPNFHLNEGSYLKVAGLSRLALWVRMGLTRPILIEGLRPAAVASAATFFREIPPLARFEVASRVITWDTKYFYFEHRFERGGRDAARVVVRSCFRDRSGVVVPATVLERLAFSDPAPALPPELEHWTRMREAARATEPRAASPPSAPPD